MPHHITNRALLHFYLTTLRSSITAEAEHSTKSWQSIYQPWKSHDLILMLLSLAIELEDLQNNHAVASEVFTSMMSMADKRMVPYDFKNCNKGNLRLFFFNRCYEKNNYSLYNGQRNDASSV